MKIVGVTKCPTGIAHTYIAAGRLEQEAEKMGYTVRVETQGAQITENALTEQEIAEADYVIIVADVAIDGRERFDNKKVVETPIKPFIKNAAPVLQQIEKLAYVQKPTQQADESTMYTQLKQTQKSDMIRQLMNGASYMIPFVVVGGLFISLSLAFGGESSVNGLVIRSTFWEKIYAIGTLAFHMMYPILSGFIAFSIAGRAAFAPSMMGALIVTDGDILGTGVGTGFLGCIIVGYVAGYFVKWVNSWHIPKSFRSMMPIFFIPICGVGIIAILFICILGKPSALFMTKLNFILIFLSKSSSTAILLGLVLGAMIGIDMGGPINKVAFLFGVTSIAEGTPQIMGITAAAIPVAPLSMGIASLIGKNKFTKEEQSAAIYTIFMGLIGISEGAIPYASADPKGVIPAIMIGSAVSGATAAAFHIAVVVPHGGLIVGALGASSNILFYILSILLGTVVSVFITLAAKKTIKNK